MFLGRWTSVFRCFHVCIYCRSWCTEVAAVWEVVAGLHSCFQSTVEAPYSRFHYSRIEKMRLNSHIRGQDFFIRGSNRNIGACIFLISSSRNVSPITPYKLPFHIHGFCIRGIFTERIPRE
uniref:SFRICE_023328 n=1 Tax=Spodoptera frugiperda TaxID=7108 RepID=A0A2H1W8R4_SPOFR